MSEHRHRKPLPISISRLRRRRPVRISIIAGVAFAFAVFGLPALSNANTAPLSGAALAKAAAAMPKPMLGGFSNDPSWYAANIGPVQIYRDYDNGFHYATWQQTAAYKMHGNAQEDYSFNLPPAQVASGADNAILKKFIATTPKNIILTNYHEPEQEIAAGQFSAAQFRAAIVQLSKLVRAQNRIDGGTRRTSVIVMYDTISGFKGRNPMDYWPGATIHGNNWAELISFDTYALPHATDTPGVPKGYTDGIKWQTPQELLDPLIAFAKKINSPWMMSELGYLDDVSNPMHKADAITDTVNYARLNGAVAVEYWDSAGRRADWRLRNGPNSAAAWKAIVNAP
jgi:hypothetical protein